MANINNYISEDICAALADEIIKANNNEVFFVCKTNDDLIVTAMRVLARGNEFSVPAVISDLQFGDVIIHNHPSGELKPSEQDISIAARLAQFGIAAYIINNTVDDIYVIIEPFKKNEYKKIEPLEIKKIFEKDGAINETLDSFEIRKQQIDMAEKVTETINNNLFACIEASTGTGKTLAYLIPSILYAIANKEKFIISTNTINLQEQIIYKDLPLIKKILNLDFKYILVKGRNNYICLNKFYKVAPQLSLFDLDNENEIFNIIKKWINITIDGSKSSLNFNPPEKVWDPICSDTDDCLKTQCVYFKDCFFNLLRLETNTAQIIVVNHHLLLSDIILKNSSDNDMTASGILPNYKYIIFDEAHNLDEIAAKHFAIQFSGYSIIKLLNKFYFLNEGKEKGIISIIKNAIIFKTKISQKEELFVLFQEIIELIEKIKTEDMPEVAEKITTYFFKNYDRANKIYNAKIKIRLIPETYKTNDFITEVEQPLINIMKLLLHLTKTIETAKNKYKQLCEDIEAQIDLNIITDFQSVINKLTNLITNISLFIEPENIENTVRWVEIDNEMPKYTSMNSIPIDVSEIFFNNVILPNNSIIFTSATLTVNKKFDFFMNNLAINKLPKERLIQMILSTPFDFEKQTRLFIPKDLVSPNDANFAYNAANFIYQLLITLERNAFILFTAYKQLREILELLRQPLENKMINVLSQFDKPRMQLLNDFKNLRRTALFATDSFWEGVDVQGDALEIVIIVKLPFKTPDDPIIEAKNEMLLKIGKNPFKDYQLPKAIIKLKQGIGRLIRTKTDKGIIVILDKRIMTMYYGQQFINSLPKMPIIYNNSKDCLTTAAEFFI